MPGQDDLVAQVAARLKRPASEPPASIMSIRPILRPLQKVSKNIPLAKATFCLIGFGVCGGVIDHQVKLIQSGDSKKIDQLTNRSIDRVAAVLADRSKKQSERGRQSTRNEILKKIKSIMAPYKAKKMPFCDFFNKLKNQKCDKLELDEDDLYTITIQETGETRKATYSTIQTWYSTSDK